MSLYSIIIYAYWESIEEDRIKRIWFYNPKRRGYRTGSGYPIYLNHANKRAGVIKEDQEDQDSPIYNDLRFPSQPKHDTIRNETKVLIEHVAGRRSTHLDQRKLYLKISGLCLPLTDEERYNYQEILNLSMIEENN